MGETNFFEASNQLLCKSILCGSERSKHHMLVKPVKSVIATKMQSKTWGEGENAFKSPLQTFYCKNNTFKCTKKY